MTKFSGKQGKKEAACVLWFTGLSGAGKSTLADKVFEDLKSGGIKAERLDGDTIRSLFPQTGFSKEERDQHIRRVGYLAHILQRNGIAVVASFISPYRAVREDVRRLCGNFVEIYVKAPLSVCEERDVKGLYKKARAGEIRQFTGIDDPYEEPLNPELVIETDKYSVEECVRMIKSYLVSYKTEISALGAEQWISR